MSSDLWLGALFSIPISVGATLIAPTLQRRIEKWSTYRAVEKSRKTHEEYALVTSFKQNPHTFTHYLIVTSIKIALISACIVITSMLPPAVGFAAGFLVSFKHTPAVEFGGGFLVPFMQANPFMIMSTVGFVFAAALTSIGAIMIINICRAALTVWARVKNYEEYKASFGIQLVDSDLQTGSISST